jgi:hypothetical protein
MLSILLPTGISILPHAMAAEQDDESKALDSTATQWSFQMAYQVADWKDDRVNGQTRPDGYDNFAQLRVVAPFQCCF